MPSRTIGILLAACLSASNAAAADSADPYSTLETVHLSNGIKAILAPSADATTVKFKIQVSAGIYNEARGKEGVAHLLEHYLFTDSKLERDMTYLEVIKEKGGEANAYTALEETVYHATLPSKLAGWGAGAFGRMLLGRTFDDSVVEHVKGPVFLEIGKPNPFSRLSVLLEDLWPDFALPVSIQESEFGVKTPRLRLGADRFNTDSLTAGDLRAFYETYYNPTNITVLVAGGFEPKHMHALLDQTLGSHPGGTTIGWRSPTPKPIRRDYYRTSATSWVPHLDVGSKMGGARFLDELIASVYIEDLSHRLMKTLRNGKGETYTVQGNVNVAKGSGTVSVSLEAPQEHYGESLTLVREMIDREARQGGITEAAFQAARDLYIKSFEHADRDSGAMMRHADRVAWLDINFPDRPKDLSDFAAAKSLTRETYVAHLKSVFAPDMHYERLQEPPLFFRFESLIILISAFSLWMKALRRGLVRPFGHGEIRWVRKLSYPPAYILQLGAVFLILLGVGISELGLTRYWERISIFQRSIFFSDYLLEVVSIGLSLLIAQGILASFARKVMIVGDRLWIKSLGFRSRTFPLSEIVSIEPCSPLRALLSPLLLWSLKNRRWYYDLRVWRQGLLLRLTDGRACILGVEDVLKIRQELLARCRNVIPPLSVSVRSAPRAEDATRTEPVGRVGER